MGVSSSATLTVWWVCPRGYAVYVDPVYNGQGMNQPVSVSTECNDPIHMYPCNIRTTYNNIVIVENFVADLFCLFCG